MKSLFTAVLMGLTVTSQPALAADAPGRAKEIAAKAADPFLPPDALARKTADTLMARINKHRDEYIDDTTKMYAMVDEVVLPHFDFTYMSQLVLGKHWRGASEAQRSAFQEGFKNLLVRTYGNALLEYSEEDVKWSAARYNKDETKAIVESEIVPPGAPPVPLQYRLRRTDTGWKVYDVTVDAISLVTNYRATYASEIRKNGLDSVIAKLNDPNDA